MKTNMWRIAEEIKTTGRVDRSFSTGLEIQSLDNKIARYLGLPFNEGVMITDVESGSAAADAGLKIGDIILTLNGFKIQDSDDVLQIFEDNELRAGDKVKMTVYREGKNYNISFRLRKS